MRAPRSPILAFAFALARARRARSSRAGVARADEQSELDKVRASYLAHQYDDAELRLRAMLDPMHGTLHDAALITQARMYLAAVLLAEGKQNEASALLEKLLLDDPQYEPDPLSFPTDVDRPLHRHAHARFAAASQRGGARGARASRPQSGSARRRRRSARPSASRCSRSSPREENVTTVHSRWAALVPFGAGQFQNGKAAARLGLPRDGGGVRSSGRP